MKNPVVKSSNPSEVQLVVGLLVREINALEDQIKLIKTKTDQALTSGSTTYETVLQGPAGPQGQKGDTGDIGDVTNHTHPEYIDIAAVDSWIGTKSTDDLPEGATNKYLTNAAVDDRVEVAINAAWITLVTGYKEEPTLNSTIATGEVYNYIFTTGAGTVTYYRLVPSGSADDAFYTTFSGGVLSGLISAKPITV